MLTATNERRTIANYHLSLQREDDEESSEDSFDQILNNKRGKKTKDRRKQPHLKRIIEDDPLKYEFQLATLCPDLKLFKDPDSVANLTPLQIAIQYKHFDIVRFIMEKMKIDIRMSLTLIITDAHSDMTAEDKQKQREIEKKTAIQEPVWFHQISEEQISYGLLTACANEDFMMFKYLWDQVGTYFWVLGQFRCVMKQLIY